MPETTPVHKPSFTSVHAETAKITSWQKMQTDGQTGRQTDKQTDGFSTLYSRYTLYTYMY